MRSTVLKDVLISQRTKTLFFLKWPLLSDFKAILKPILKSMGSARKLLFEYETAELLDAPIYSETKLFLSFLRPLHPKSACIPYLGVEPEPGAAMIFGLSALDDHRGRLPTHNHGIVQKQVSHLSELGVLLKPIPAGFRPTSSNPAPAN